MSSAVGSSDISFSGLQTAQNLVYADMANPISLSEFRGKVFTDGSSVPGGSDAISISSHLRGKVFGSSSFDTSGFSAGVSGTDEGAFPATSGQSYLFIYSKDISFSQPSESCTITFQTSSYNVHHNGGDTDAEWSGDATTHTDEEDTSWSNSGTTFTAQNVGTDSSYSYLWVTLTANMGINWTIVSEPSYDKLYIYIVGFFHQSTLTLGSNATGSDITFVINSVGKSISTSGTGVWSLGDGSFALNSNYPITSASGEVEGLETSFTNIVGCTISIPDNWNGYDTNNVRFTSAVSSFTVAVSS